MNWPINREFNPLKKRAELKKDLLIEEIMRENVYRKIVVTPKGIKRYYKDHIDEFSMKREYEFQTYFDKVFKL